MHSTNAWHKRMAQMFAADDIRSGSHACNREEMYRQNNACTLLTCQASYLIVSGTPISNSGASHCCLALSVNDLLKITQRDKLPQSQLGLPCALKESQTVMHVVVSVYESKGTWSCQLVKYRPSGKTTLITREVYKRFHFPLNWVRSSVAC